jgi:hypothetical protein
LFRRMQPQQTRNPCIYVLSFTFCALAVATTPAPLPDVSWVYVLSCHRTWGSVTGATTRALQAVVVATAPSRDVLFVAVLKTTTERQRRPCKHPYYGGWISSERTIQVLQPRPTGRWQGLCTGVYLTRFNPCPYDVQQQDKKTATTQQGQQGASAAAAATPSCCALHTQPVPLAMDDYSGSVCLRAPAQAHR